mmetsp:Transcript_32433/g.67650  ORF Transcript_32433/g.67650 Transcript_32433/m.67650 type:complete len:176 (-) Transcript_32433:27-554(-)
MSQNDVSNTAVTNEEEIQTAKWTRYLPETFGIRDAIQKSKYRWCAREAGMWGIATGTAMTLHRWRMGSRTHFAVHAGFVTLMVVNVGSYYFCVKRRDYQEQMIEIMMKYNEFDHAMNMPEEASSTDGENPFLETGPKGKGNVTPSELVVNLPERKEWQPQLPTQDAADVFRPAKD